MSPHSLQFFTALCCTLNESPSPASRHFFHKKIDWQEHIFCLSLEVRWLHWLLQFTDWKTVRKQTFLGIEITNSVKADKNEADFYLFHTAHRGTSLPIHSLFFLLEWTRLSSLTLALQPSNHPTPWSEQKSCCGLIAIQPDLDFSGHNWTVITQIPFFLPLLLRNAEWCTLSDGNGIHTCVSLYSSTLVSMATTEIAGLLYKLVGEIQNTSPYAAASWTSFSSPGLRRASLCQGL